MSKFRFGGLNLALATPFDENGKVDYGRLEENIDKYIDAGIRSFLLSSGTGVHVYLSRDEAAELVTRGARLINGRATVIAQTSALLADEVVDRTKHAADNGVDGVMVLPPFFEGPAGDDELFSFYESVGAGGLPIIGYNVPGGVAPPSRLNYFTDSSRSPILFR